MKRKAMKEQSLDNNKKEFKKYNSRGNQNKISKMHKIDLLKPSVACKTRNR
jgi:hypothetical protein